MISLTFDDAIDEHLDVAAPLLDQFGLVATFYTHLSSDTFFERRSEWKQLALTGHEIGGHTVFHPADSRKLWVSEGIALDQYGPDRMRQELAVANQYLTSLDGRQGRTFAYPCSNSTLGHYGMICKSLFRMGLRNTRLPRMVERCRMDFGSTRFEYSSIVSEFFSAARSGGLYLSMTSPPADQLPRFHLPSAAVDGHSFAEMREFIERSLGAKGWPILQFHGVGGGHHMDCDRSEFEKLMAWLRR